MAWHCICTKPTQEIRAGVELTKQGFHVYMPVLKAKPLFPRYIFSEFDRDRDNWGLIRSTRGCIDVLKNGFRPIVVRQPIMDAIMSFQPPPEPEQTIQNFTLHQTIRIKSGLLQGYEGLFQGTDKQRVRAFLDILGSRIEVPMSDLAATS